MALIDKRAAAVSQVGGTLSPDGGENVQLVSMSTSFAGIVSKIIKLIRQATSDKIAQPQRIDPTFKQPSAIEPEAPPVVAPEVAPTVDVQIAPQPGPVFRDPNAPAPVGESAYGAYKDDGDVVGIDFNMSNLNTSTDVKNRINEVSKEFAAQTTKQTQGVVSLKEIRQVADMLGTSDEAAEKAIKGLPSDVENLSIRATVMRDTMVKSAEEVDALAKAIDQDPTLVTDMQRFEFRKKLVEHAALQAQMKGVQTEVARALSAFRIPAGSSSQGRLDAVSEIIQASGGRDTADELAKRWLATPVEDRGKFAVRSPWAKTKAAVYQLWINGLLSGLRTHEVNMLSNTVFTLWQLPERMIGAAIGKTRQLLPNANPDRVAGMEAIAMMHGLVESIPDAFRLAARVFKRGTPSTVTTKLENVQQDAISTGALGYQGVEWFGHMINQFGILAGLPGRFLMSSDEFSKLIARRMELRAQSYRASNAALDEGKTAKEAAEVYTSVLRGEVDYANRAAEVFADTVTFTKTLSVQGRAFTDWINKTPGGRIIMPFIRTPANILKEFGKRTVLAPAMKEVKADFAAGGARRDMALARIATGTAAMIYASYLASQGVITGGGPTDPKLRAVWREKYAPYSVKIGDEWYPYGRLEPIGTLFGVAADYTDFQKWAPRDIDPTDRETLAARALGAVMHNVGQKSFLSGIAAFAEAYNDPIRYGSSYTQRLIGGLAQPFYSSFLRDVEAALDPEFRDTKVDPRETHMGVKNFYSILNEITSRTPGLSSDLPPIRNFWGEPIKAYEGHWLHAFNAFRPKSDKSDAAVDEILRLNTPITMPQRQVSGVKLNPQQYDQLVVNMNQISAPNQATGTDMNMRQALNWLIKTPMYQGLTDMQKVEQLRKIRNTYVDAAGDLLKTTDVDLLAQTITSQALRGAGLPAPK